MLVANDECMLYVQCFVFWEQREMRCDDGSRVFASSREKLSPLVTRLQNSCLLNQPSVFLFSVNTD
jgi:hypothetical protein